MKKTLGILTVALLLLSGCSTLVNIRTIPSGAKVLINGQPAGSAPIRQKMSNFDFKDYNVQISKDGYQTVYQSLNKEVKPGALIVGLLLWWPDLLWAYGPSANQVFELTKSK